MTTHATIDIETLSTKPDAVVLTIGGIKFDPFTKVDPHSEFYYRLEIEDQTSKGRDIESDTLQWWGTQPDEIVDEALGDHNRTSVETTLKELNKWLTGADKIWCQGPQFDMVILENLFTQFNHHKGWAFWQIMDCRTIFNMMPMDPRKAIQQNLHSADADAYYQAVCVQQTYKHFNVTER